MEPPKWQLRLSPRGWQERALSRWKRNHRGVVEVVTGGGKTAFALMCVAHFREAKCTEDSRTVVVVPTLALADQWHVSVLEDLGAPESAVAIYSGEEKPTRPREINIVVLNSARALSERLSRDVAAFLVVDECHRAGSPVNSKALRGSFEATLGLSATPRREYDEGFEKYIEPALGPVIFSYDYKAAAVDNVIVPFDLINVQFDMLPHEEERYQKFSSRIARLANTAKAEEDKLKRLLQLRASVSANAALRVPVTVRLLDNHRGERSIIFHERVDTAERIANMLRERGHAVTTYHSRIAPNVRRDNLRLFRKGVYEVLVTCRALDEGLNVPEVSTAIVASSTASQRQRIQRLGRVLRPAPGKATATVYTLYGTKVEQRRLAQEATQMQEIAEIAWKSSRVTGYGKDSN